MTITVTIPSAGQLVSEEEYRAFSLGDPDERWELHDGRLREKPGMSVVHGDVLTTLVATVFNQLDRNEFRVRANHARLRRSAKNYYIPDVAVIPTTAERALRRDPLTLDAYPDALPLVVEIWSPSTGDYDSAEKLPQYQLRGDLEIWLLHPDERTLRAWRRRPDGGYDETTVAGGLARPVALPGMVIDLDAVCAP